MKYLYIITLLCFASCIQKTRYEYYKTVLIDETVVEYSKEEYYTWYKNIDVNTKYDESISCTYWLATILPLNFWDITSFKKSSEIKQALHKIDRGGLGMRNVTIEYSGSMIPLLFFTGCKKVRGIIIEE